MSDTYKLTYKHAHSLTTTNQPYFPNTKLGVILGLCNYDQGLMLTSCLMLFDLHPVFVYTDRVSENAQKVDAEWIQANKTIT